MQSLDTAGTHLLVFEREAVDRELPKQRLGDKVVARGIQENVVIDATRFLLQDRPSTLAGVSDGRTTWRIWGAGAMRRG
jgi:hypothetical protein